MTIEMGKEHDMMRLMVRRFAESEVEPLAAELDTTGRFPRETVDKMKNLGLLGIPFPVETGGSGGDELAYAVAVEELSRACASTGVICSAHTSLGAWPVYKYGTPEQKEKFLRPLAEGRCLGAFGLTEPNAGTDASAQQTRAVRDGDDWVINGSKLFITNGGEAGIYVIIAVTDKDRGTRGITAFIVESGTEGFSIGKKEAKMGIKASATTELIFKNCRIPASQMLGNEGDGFKIALATLDGGRIGIAAQALGIAQGAFDKTIDYVGQRKQFGKPISRLQAVQFELAEMKTRIEAARMLVYKAAQMKKNGTPYAAEAAMAKLYASETAMHVTTKAVQLHGGYGYTMDYPVERMMRDAKITEIYEGTSEVQKIVIAASVLN